MNKKIKFIYFDVGGVAILDFSKTEKFREMMKDLGVNELSESRFKDIFAEFEPKICVNKKSLDEFIEVAKSELKLNLPENYSMLDDFVNRFDPNASMAPILNKLSKKFKLGLLTNMYPGMLNKIIERNIMPQVKWDVVIDSSVVKLGKPQIAIYELAERLAGYSAEGILFVENTAINIDIAKKRGWQTLLYDPSDIFDSNRKLEIMTEIKK